MIYKAGELFEKLSGEQKDGHYFRGQEREYPGPLWPSKYRRVFRSADCLPIHKPCRLRKTGTHFHLCMGAVDWQPYSSEEEYRKAVTELQFRNFIMSHIRNALGYPLAEAWFQQAGMSSEGLDITADLKVAFFFAMYRFNGKTYEWAGHAADPGVIYRWKLTPQPWTFQTLNSQNFYSCPPLVPVKQIFESFEACDTIDQCLHSLAEYQETIQWSGLAFDLEAVQGKRPFHLIKLPKAAVESSRIVNQQAALLLPDVVTAEDFLANYGVSSPQVVQEIRSGSFVEDLAQSPLCEKFYFDPSSAQSMGWLKEMRQEQVFPEVDVLFTLLRGWMRRLIQNPFGTLPIFMDAPAMDYGEMMTRLLGDCESSYFS